jgi:hypothetical protein
MSKYPYPWRLWLFTRYSWGWDIGPVFGYWLVWSKPPLGRRWPFVYVSNDATPPRAEGARGFYIARG